MIKQKSNKGFTLAEVLVTLAIIGVVAALTIPGLISKNQAQAWSTGYKEAYNIIENATKMVKEENGGSMLNAWGAANDNEGMFRAYEPYLRIVKKCEDMSPVNECMGSGYKYISGESADPSGVHYYAAYLSNGFSLVFWASEGAGALGDGNYIYVDTNGKKGPNILGKDYHAIRVFVQPDPVKPQNYNVGAGNVINYCPNDLKTSAATFVGRTCGLRILRGDYAKNY